MITVEQHTGKRPDGTTVAYAFDDVFWADGPKKRRVAIAGHGANDPLQWLEEVPEATAAEVRQKVKARRDARNTAAEKDRGTTATG